MLTHGMYISMRISWVLQRRIQWYRWKSSRKLSYCDPGYAGLDEMIFFEQIVGIEGEPGYALLAR